MAKSATVLKMKKKPVFADMLKATAKPKKAAAKKSTVTTLDAPEKVREAVDKVIEAKKSEKSAKSTISVYGAIVIDFTRTAQDTDGFKKKFQNSYAVPGTKEENVLKCISSNRFTINAEDDEALQELLGKDYEDCINKKYGVKLTTEAMEDEALMAELMELVGDRFTDFFETTVALSVKEKFNERIYHVLAAEDLPTLRTFAKQYNPSLR